MKSETGDVCTGRAAATVRVIDTLDALEEIRPAWTSWHGHRDADFDVYRTLLGCRSDAAEPHILVVERDRRPDAILVGTTHSATVSERIGYWTIPMGQVRVLSFQYGGFLGNQSEENSKLIISAVEQSLRAGVADAAILSYVREDTPLRQSATHCSSLLMRDHFPTKHSHSLMVLPSRVEALYEGLSSEHRWKLRRDAKRFRAAFADLKITRFASPDHLEELFRDVEEVAASTYQRGLSVGFSSSQTIRKLLSLQAKQGWLRGYVLYAGNRPCAFWIGCIYDGTFLSDYLGHDASYAKYSPGSYLLMHAMEELCREGVTAIDFNIGEALYKQRFGNRQWNENTIYLYAPTWMGMRVKTLRTVAVFIDSTAKSLLGTKLSGRVKRMWRNRLAAGSSQRRTS